MDPYKACSCSRRTISFSLQTRDLAGFEEIFLGRRRRRRGSSFPACDAIGADQGVESTEGPMSASKDRRCIPCSLTLSNCGCAALNHSTLPAWRYLGRIDPFCTLLQEVSVKLVAFSRMLACMCHHTRGSPHNSLRDARLKPPQDFEPYRQGCGLEVGECFCRAAAITLYLDVRQLLGVW